MNKSLWRLSIVIICTLLLVSISLSSCKTSGKTTASTTAAETTAVETTAVAETTAAETTAGSDGVTEIIIYLVPFGNKPYENLWWDMIAEFEKLNPDIKVRVWLDGNNAYRDKIKLLIAANDLPDLSVSWGPGYVEPAIKNGAVQDWATYLNEDPEWKNKISPAALKSQKRNDFEVAVLPIPGKAIGLGLWVNTELLSKYGLEIPQTFESWLEQIKILKKNEIIPIAYGAKDLWSTWAFNVFLRRYAGGENATEKFDNILAGKEKFNNPDFLKGLNHLKELADTAAFSPNAATIGYAQAQQQFFSGEAAYINTGTWETPMFYEQLGDKIKFIPVPAFSDAIDNSLSFEVTYGEGWQLSSKTQGKKLEAVLKFLKWLPSPENAQKFVDISELTAFNVDADLSKMVIPQQENVKLLREGSVLPGQIEAFMPGSFTGLYNETMTNVALGLVSPEEAVSLFDEWYEREYAK
ncbi:MAG: extracellular solute-binding protein [Actinobacteria bacterium]|nr:extracellular solute-binding protein [Actinomycetota bacterium]